MFKILLPAVAAITFALGIERLPKSDNFRLNDEVGGVGGSGREGGGNAGVTIATLAGFSFVQEAIWITEIIKITYSNNVLIWNLMFIK